MSKLINIKCVQTTIALVRWLQQKGINRVFGEREKEIISELTRYMIQFESGRDLSTPEKEAEFDKAIGEVVKDLRNLMPELDERKIQNILENLEKKCSPYMLSPPPEIPKEHMELVKKTHDHILQQKLNLRKILDTDNS